MLCTTVYPQAQSGLLRRVDIGRYVRSVVSGKIFYVVDED